MSDRNLTHYVVVTGIIVNKEGKFLITKRADWEKAFPGRWTVPGGKLEVIDYALRDKDTPYHWYNVIEDLLKREVMEEVGLEVKNIDYATSLVYIRPDKIPCLIMSLFAEAVSEDVKLCNALTEHVWVNLEEAKNYDLIEGIYDELFMVEKKIHGEKILWEPNIKSEI